MTITKDQLDQAIELEERLAAMLEQEARSGVLSNVPSADYGHHATSARLAALKMIRHSMDFDGHAKAWDEANPPASTTGSDHT